MSRLDDELKVAFRRQEPSADFAAQVLSRLNAEASAAPPAETRRRRILWQTLLEFFQPNALRWALAAAVLLIAGIAFIQYQRLAKPANPQRVEIPQPPSVDQPQVAGGPDVQEEGRQGKDKNLFPKAQPPGPKPDASPNSPAAHRVAARHKRPAVGNGVTRRPDTQIAVAPGKSPGEVAKEQLMKALAITSTLISEAKEMALGGRD